MQSSQSRQKKEKMTQQRNTVRCNVITYIKLKLFIHTHTVSSYAPIAADCHLPHIILCYASGERINRQRAGGKTIKDIRWPILGYTS